MSWRISLPVAATIVGLTITVAAAATIALSPPSRSVRPGSGAADAHASSSATGSEDESGKAPGSAGASIPPPATGRPTEPGGSTSPTSPRSTTGSPARSTGPLPDFSIAYQGHCFFGRNAPGQTPEFIVQANLLTTWTGSAPFAPNTMRLKLGNLQAQTVNLISAGSEGPYIYVPFTTAYPPQTVNLVVDIDANNQVRESNENNNRLVLAVRFTGTDPGSGTELTCSVVS